MRVNVEKFHVHRFGDRVALWDGVHETVYISEDLALKLAEALMIVSHDVRTFKFTDSKAGTRVVGL